MTPFRKDNVLTQLSGKLKRGGLYLTMAAALAASGCGGDSKEAQWEEVTVQEPTKGVVTTLREKAKDDFEIVDEQVVENKADSRVIINRLDGTTVNLTLAEAQAMVQPGDTVVHHNTQHRAHNPMGSVLWYGAMGYMMGRNMGSPVNQGFYAPASRQSSTSGTNGAPMGGSKPYYGNAAANGADVQNNLRSTATSRTVSRPVGGGRSGFFGGSSRSGASS